MLFTPLCNFPSAQRTSFNISYSACLLVVNYLTFCLSKKRLYFAFTFWRRQNSQLASFSFFSFSILKRLFHCLLAFIISDEKSVFKILFLCMWLLGYLIFLNLFLSQQYNYNVSRCGFAYIFASWDWLSFWGLLVNIFHQIRGKTWSSGLQILSVTPFLFPFLLGLQLHLY